MISRLFAAPDRAEPVLLVKDQALIASVLAAVRP